MQEKSYVLVDDQDKVKDMVSKLSTADTVAFDTETNSLNPRHGKIIGFSVSTEVGNGYYMPTMIYDKTTDSLVETQINGIPCNTIAKKIIDNYVNGKKLVMHNASFDCRFVYHFYGIDLTPSLYVDTMLLVHTVMEEGAGPSGGGTFSLKGIAKHIQNEIGLDVEKEANEEQIELKTSIKTNGGSITKDNFEIYKADIDILGKYAAADTDLTLRIYEHFMQVLEQEQLEKFFFEDEVMPLYKEVTIPMEMKGVKLDMELIQQANVEVSEKLEEYRSKVITELIKHAGVRAWVVKKALEEYAPSNKGSFAQELVKYLNLPLPITEKSGKYDVKKATVMKLEDTPFSRFLLTGEVTEECKETFDKISMKMWKDSNDGHYFNVQSKLHLGEIAFGVLGLKPLSKTPTGAPQFDDDMIESIQEKHPWAKELRIYNRLLKIKSTYIDRFLLAQENGRYYFSYKQHGTVSGRYGSDAQQLPRPKEDGDDDPIVIKYNNMVRAFFVPESGNEFIDCDYESLEPHVFAHVSGDEGLKDIFRNNWDFYSTIAIKTEGLKEYSPDKKAENYLRKHNPKLRNKAKAYALGIPYGMGAYALGMNLGIQTKEAKKLVDGYLNGFPELKKWMDRSAQDAKTLGYVKTQVGRVRHLPKVKKIYESIGDGILDYEVRTMMESIYGKEKVLNIKRDFVNGVNNSRNVQIQGLAASIVNRAALAINREFKLRGIDGWVCAQIHDQLICEVPADRAEECAKIVQDKMENTTKLSIALKAPPAIAHNWRDGH